MRARKPTAIWISRHRKANTAKMGANRKDLFEGTKLNRWYKNERRHWAEFPIINLEMK
jgi:hypothetical protein